MFQEGSMPMNPEETRAYFIQYINICNLALRHNKDVVPYKQIVELGSKVFEGKNIIVKVYAENVNRPVDCYTIRLNDGTFDVVAYDPQDGAFEWNLRENYLENVVKNSHRYIARPEKLEWDWLKSRMGLSKV